MRAKDKAEELWDKFYMGDDFPVKCGTYCEGGTPNYQGIAKRCALICVDEILDESDHLDLGYNDSNEIGGKMDARYSYWQEVKQEIKKL